MTAIFTFLMAAFTILNLTWPKGASKADIKMGRILSLLALPCMVVFSLWQIGLVTVPENLLEASQAVLLLVCGFLAGMLWHIRRERKLQQQRPPAAGAVVLTTQAANGQQSYEVSPGERYEEPLVQYPE